MLYLLQNLSKTFNSYHVRLLHQRTCYTPTRNAPPHWNEGRFRNIFEGLNAKYEQANERLALCTGTFYDTMKSHTFLMCNVRCIRAPPYFAYLESGQTTFLSRNRANKPRPREAGQIRCLSLGLHTDNTTMSDTSPPPLHLGHPTVVSLLLVRVCQLNKR